MVIRIVEFKPDWHGYEHGNAVVWISRMQRSGTQLKEISSFHYDLDERRWTRLVHVLKSMHACFLPEDNEACVWVAYAAKAIPASLG